MRIGRVAKDRRASAFIQAVDAFAIRKIKRAVLPRGSFARANQAVVFRFDASRERRRQRGARDESARAMAGTVGDFHTDPQKFHLVTLGLRSHGADRVTSVVCDAPHRSPPVQDWFVTARFENRYFSGQ
jgi:hypothetical protein